MVTLLRLAWRRSPRLRRYFHLASGKRLFAIWSLRDPLPMLAWFFTGFIWDLMVACVHWICARLKRQPSPNDLAAKEGGVYARHLEG
jgi:hypothetical protein